MIVPLSTFRDPITVGSELLTTKDITKSKIMLCTLLGLICNILIICLMEWFTSHGCASVRNMAVSSVKRVPSMHMIYSQYLGGLCGYVPLVVLGVCVYGSIEVGGYVGPLYFTAGFLSIVMVLMVVLFIGAASTDSHILSSFVNM
jgi:Na+/H+-translocating membrane pyrophosphatase